VSPSSLRATIDSRLEEVCRVRKAIAGMECAPFSTEEWHQVETGVGEAVNNAIIHAYGREPGHKVEVEVRIEADRVVCSVTDHGRPLPAEARKKPKLEVAPDKVEELPEGGMGLYIIHQVMDRIDYESKGGRNVLTLVKKVKGR
jgi:anti-sigma regulatory factor (Ser/Thr protein kinase)